MIKENRTFDQVFGDMGFGEADPSLTMYGDDITPNLHKLAKQFGILDNFYDSGDVSATATSGPTPPPFLTTSQKPGPSPIVATSIPTTPKALS